MSTDRDRAVAVVVGSILLVAIMVSFLTAFVAWYVPSNGNTNEVNFQKDTVESYLQLSNSFNSSSIVPGEYLTEPFQMGIAGVPPFTSASQTTMGVSGNSSSFSAVFNLVLNVTYQNGNYQVVKTGLNITGYIYSDAYFQYTNKIQYVFEDGYLIEIYEPGHTGQALGTLPVSMNGNNLLLKGFSLEGGNRSVASTSSMILTLEVKSLNASIDISVGSQFDNNTVSGISVVNLSYVFHSPYSGLLEGALSKALNPTQLTSNGHGNITWISGNGDLKAIYKNGESLSIFGDHSDLALSSISLVSGTVEVVSF